MNRVYHWITRTKRVPLPSSGSLVCDSIVKYITDDRKVTGVFSYIGSSYSNPVHLYVVHEISLHDGSVYSFLHLYVNIVSLLSLFNLFCYLKWYFRLCKKFWIDLCLKENVYKSQEVSLLKKREVSWNLKLLTRYEDVP